MRSLSYVLLAALVATPPAYAQAAALPADALVATAAATATVAPFARDAHRVKLLIAASRAQVRRGNKPAALALLDEAARRAARFDRVAGPLDQPRALAEVAIALRGLAQADRAKALLADAERLTPADRKAAYHEALGRMLAEAGYAAEAETALQGVSAPDARALLAGAWRRAKDGKRAAQRAGEALALWQRLPADQAQAAAPELAASLWRAGYPQQALELAGKLPKAAWPDAPFPLVLAIAEEGPPEALRKATLDWIGVAIERCDTTDFRKMPREGELLAGVSRAFTACKEADRAYIILFAADERITDAIQRAGDQADSNDLTAARAAALVAVGDAYLRVGKGKEGQDRFARGDRLAASLEGQTGERDLASETRSEAAVARARAGVPEAAVQSALEIKDPYMRGIALLGIDELVPGAAGMLTEETRKALSDAARPVDGDR